MIKDEFKIRVRYSDTDQMKVVYYAEYLRYFEDGRASLLRKLNFPYSTMELELGIFLPVIESFAKYHRPALFEDLITIETQVKEIPNKLIQFDSFVYRGDLLLVSGFTKHLFVNIDNKVVDCPELIKEAFRKNT